MSDINFRGPFPSTYSFSGFILSQPNLFTPFKFHVFCAAYKTNKNLEDDK